MLWFEIGQTDDSVTYWFLWKHPMARRRGLEFGVFDQTPPKTGSALQASRLDLLSSIKLPQPKHRLGPSGLAIRLFRRLCTKTQPKCGLGPAGLALGASQMHQTPIFRPFDVHLAVSDMLRSTPTTPSVHLFVILRAILSGKVRKSLRFFLSAEW